jgi:hypothetical protein
MQFADLTFGVEIECYIPTATGQQELTRALQAAGIEVSRVGHSIHTTTTGWKIVHDGSLNSPPRGTTGCEVVSPILKGEEGIAQVVTVANIVKTFGGQVNRSCGLHVHVGARDATPTQLKNLAKMFIKYEHHFDALCPESRRNGNRFAASNRAIASGHVAGDYATVVAAAFARLDPARSVRAIAEVMNGSYNSGHHYHHARYFKLNYQSMASHGTVEFRQQAGTVEAQKMVAWIRLVVGLVATAFTLKSVSSQNEPTFGKLLKKVDVETAKYLKHRRVALNRGAVLED